VVQWLLFTQFGVRFSIIWGSTASWCSRHSTTIDRRWNKIWSGSPSSRLSRLQMLHPQQSQRGSGCSHESYVQPKTACHMARFDHWPTKEDSEFHILSICYICSVHGKIVWKKKGCATSSFWKGLRECGLGPLLPSACVAAACLLALAFLLISSFSRSEKIFLVPIRTLWTFQTRRASILEMLIS